MMGVQRAVQCSVLGLALALSGCQIGVPSTDLVEVQLLAFNDLHGTLESPTSGFPPIFPTPSEGPRTTPSGGIARLATLIKARQVGHAHSIVVGAGDLIGGSPFLSSRFHDEPTIEALDAIGLQLSAVGNHEFDEGAAELRRIQQGGCHPVDGCLGPSPYQGAAFRYLAANVIDETTGTTLLPAHAIREFDGIRIGFIGLTLEDTPSLIIPSARNGLRFLDEADTINTQVAQLRQQGVEAVVVLIHEGGYTSNGPTDCASLSGAITDILPKLDAAVDVVVSGHTHRAYQCEVDGVLLTSAGQYGTQLTDIALSLDRASGDIVATRADTLVVATATTAEDPALTALVATYRTLAEPMMQREVGSVSAPLLRERNAAGESLLGHLIADAMLAAAERVAGERADLALMNPGGIRTDIAKAGPVRFNDLFAVQPFGNNVQVLTLTGTQIEAVLQQQFARKQEDILQVSQGFHYRWRRQGASATVVPGSITVNGQPLAADRRYRVVTNNFLAEGGDGFTAFRAGTNVTQAGGDIDALEAYLASHSPLSPPTDTRITLDTTP